MPTRSGSFTSGGEHHQRAQRALELVQLLAPRADRRSRQLDQGRVDRTADLQDSRATGKIRIRTREDGLARNGLWIMSLECLVAQARLSHRTRDLIGA